MKVGELGICLVVEDKEEPSEGKGDEAAGGADTADDKAEGDAEKKAVKDKGDKEGEAERKKNIETYMNLSIVNRVVSNEIEGRASYQKDGFKKH